MHTSHWASMVTCDLSRKPPVTWCIRQGIKGPIFRRVAVIQSELKNSSHRSIRKNLSIRSFLLLKETSTVAGIQRNPFNGSTINGYDIYLKIQASSTERISVHPVSFQNPEGNQISVGTKNITEVS